MSENELNKIDDGGTRSYRPTMDFTELDKVDPSMFDIDRNALDIEWERQASNVFTMGRITAQARFRWEDLKRQLELRKCEEAKAIRTDPEKYGLSKVTEVAVTNIIGQLPEIVDLSQRVISAQYQYNLCMAGMDALENRKKGLECLTQLRAINYYSAK
jgi:hypothetical protein